MFEIDRTFSQYSPETGLTEWYFNARDGVFGPYRTRKIAEVELKKFIEKQKKLKDDGGRKSGKAKLTLMPLEYSLDVVDVDYIKPDKDIDDEWSKK
jgi:hypothetical protein